MAIKSLLLADTETSGIDPKTSVLLEVAAVWWSVEHACVLKTWSTLVQGARNDAFAVNGIPAEALPLGAAAEPTFKTLRNFADNSDAIVAHNAEFDRGFLPELGKPWICSMNDLAWPGAKPGGYTSLIDLALANGLGIASAHRALSDCLLLARLFERLHERGTDLQAFLAHGLRPKGMFVAEVPFAEKDKAKDAGFKWRPETKQWVRRLALEDAGKLPFRVRQLEDTQFMDPR